MHGVDLSICGTSGMDRRQYKCSCAEELMLVNQVESGHRLSDNTWSYCMQALVKYLDNVSDEDIPSLEIPTGVPLIYELDENLKPIKHYYVG